MLKRALILAAATIALGCAPTQEEVRAKHGVRQYLNGNFAGATRTLAPLAEKADENYVLNNLRLGATALAEHDFDSAESAYYKAYQVLNQTNVNDAGRQARAVWLSESSKVWRGEPFERAVANFQLGLIYYSRGDYNNARGAFENALFKLRDYKKTEKEDDSRQEGDFAVALLMLGRVWTHLDRPDEASRYFDRVKQLRPTMSALADAMADLRNNTLLFIDYGFGPRKIDSGMDGAQIAFVPRPSEAGELPPPLITADGAPVALPMPFARPTFDTLEMAMERRWQAYDTIRATKSGIGTGLMVAGAGATIYGAGKRDEGVALAGIGALALGALLKASSSADTRVWEMVPRTTWVIPIRLEPGTHELTVGFATGLYQTWRNVEVPSEGEASLYFRMMRWTSGEYTMPPANQSMSADVR